MTASDVVQIVTRDFGCIEFCNELHNSPFPRVTRAISEWDKKKGDGRRCQDGYEPLSSLRPTLRK